MNDSDNAYTIMQNLYALCIGDLKKQTGITVSWTEINMNVVSLLDSR